MIIVIAFLTTAVTTLALVQSPMWASLLPFVLFTLETGHDSR
ncbi:hypothetical protein VPH49_24865 [Pseudomonas luteola]